MSSALDKFPPLLKKRQRRVGVIRDIARNPASYILLAPAFVYVLIFGYLTLPYMIIGFQKFNYQAGMLGSEWVGFENFAFFFKTVGGRVTWNTVKLNLLFIFFTIIVALSLSMFLNELKSRVYVRVTQSLYLLPHFISWIIASYMVYALFKTQGGVVNGLLTALGRDAVRWYSTPGPWTWILVVLRVWHGAGFYTVIFLAALTAIDPQLYEAATIDGAGRFQQAIRITLPLIAPTAAIMTLLAIGRVFYGDFALIYAIVRDNGLLYPTTDVIDTFVFRALRRTGTPSQAMAVGMYQSVLGFIFVYGANLFTRRFFSEGALF